MSEFLRQIGGSVYSPGFYNEARGKSFGYSFKYYLKLSLLVTLVTTVVLTAILYPKAKFFINNFAEGLGSKFPSDLVVTFKSGKVSTTAPEPYFVRMADIVSPEDLGEGDPENLLVIDTQTPFSLEQFEEYNSLVWLTEDSAVMLDDNGSVRIQSLAQVPDVTIDKVLATKYLGIAQTYLRLAPLFLIPIGIFIFTFIAQLGRLIYLLLAALILWLLAMAFKRNLTYGKTYQLAMYAVTLPVLVFKLLWLPIGVQLPIFVFSLALTAMFFLNVRAQIPTVPEVVPAS
ncbi:MAG TPA: DUF1189 family protein [Candidatus Paceibacterota bacterium]